MEADSEAGSASPAPSPTPPYHSSNPLTRDRSRKSSSRDVVVSHRRHCVSVTSRPWKIRRTHDKLGTPPLPAWVPPCPEVDGAFSSSAARCAGAIAGAPGGLRGCGNAETPLTSVDSVGVAAVGESPVLPPLARLMLVHRIAHLVQHVIQELVRILVVVVAEHRVLLANPRHELPARGLPRSDESRCVVRTPLAARSIARGAARGTRLGAMTPVRFLLVLICSNSSARHISKFSSIVSFTSA